MTLGGLFLSALTLSGIITCSGDALHPTSPRGVPPPEIVIAGPTFRHSPARSPLARFIRSRSWMHAWLYNGDDLFPKQLNLCSRGRNTLLDLDLGPGAAYDIGLFGPAWEAHLFALALSISPHRGDPLARTPVRFLYCWPVVSTAQLEVLRSAHRLGRLARRSAWTWRDSPHLVRRLRVKSFAAHRLGRPRAQRLRPAEQRRLAREWALRVKVAWLRRLRHSASQLLSKAPAGRDQWPSLMRRALAFDEVGRASIDHLEALLISAAKKRGLLFDSKRYRAFHDEHLVGRVGPPGREAHLGMDGLQLVIARLEATRRAEDRPVLRHAREELARVSYVRDGIRLPALSALVRRVGRSALERTRAEYLGLKRKLEAARARLAQYARRAFSPAVRARLLETLRRHRGPLLAGSFYFETEHLMQTSSGFTHVGLIKRLPDPNTGRPLLWMFDRVIGFHYAYPVSKLTHSVPVQVMSIAPEHLRPRAYRWLRARVPRVFRFGEKRRSSQVRLINLFVHVRSRLRACPRLFVTPGFYYAASTWIINHPRNRSVLADLWAPRRFTGYGYRTLDSARLERLPGRVLYLPVRERPMRGWSRGCPPRKPGFTWNPDTASGPRGGRSDLAPE